MKSIKLALNSSNVYISCTEWHNQAWPSVTMYELVMSQLHGIVDMNYSLRLLFLEYDGV